MTELNFAEDCSIDLDDLHTEWATHAHKRKAYADEVAHLENELKQLHQKEKVVRSKLILEAKEKGHTNASLQEAYYRTHPDHEAIKKKKIQTEYDLSMAWNALKAMDDKKAALENEVKLFKCSYYATPRETRETQAGKIMVKSSAKTREAVNEKRKRK